MLSFKNLSIRRQQMLLVLLTTGAALGLACAAFTVSLPVQPPQPAKQFSI